MKDHFIAISQIVKTYADLDKFKSHCKAEGYDLAEYTDGDIEPALRTATDHLDAAYGSRFIGEATKLGQPLAWPRKRAKFQGRFFSDNEIPEKIVAAVCELAFMALSETNDDQGGTVIENLLSGLIHPDQSKTAVFSSISQV